MKLSIVRWRLLQDVELDFSEPGITLLTGRNLLADYASSNGVGKTSLIHCITWVLFGKHPGLGGANEVIPDDHPKTLVDATVTYSGTLKVRRTRAKGKTQVWVNDGQLDVDAAQERIVGLLGFTYERWVELLTYVGDKKIALLTDAGLKTILTSLMPIDVTLAEKPAKEKVRACDLHIANYDGAIQEAKRRLEHNKTLHGQEMINSSRWEVWAREQLPAAEAKEAAARASLDQAIGAITDLGRQIEAARSPEHHRRVAAAAASVQNLNDQLQQARNNLRFAEARVAEKAPSPPICNSCGQPSMGPAAAAAEHDAWKVRVAEATNTKAATIAQIDQLTAQLQAAEEEHRTATAAMQTAEQNIPSLEAARAKAQTDRPDLERAHTDAQDELRRLRTNPHATAIQNLHTMIEQDAAYIQEQETAREQERTTREFWVYVANLCGKRGLMHFALEKIMPHLTAEGMKLLTSLSPEHLQLRFRSTTDAGKEKFHIEARSAAGGDSHTKLSRGELMRIDVALFVALFLQATQGLPMRVMLLDEVLDSALDSKGQESMVAGLSEIAMERGIHIVLTTNDPDIINDFQRTARCLTVCRTSEGSRVLQ